MMTRLSIVALVLVLHFAGSPPPPIDACAAVWRHNSTVEIASESAIIIWDEKTKTQHFIRRASFLTSAAGEAKLADFGFLVPTPTQPKIAEADDKAFDELAKITAPATEYHKRPATPGGGCGGCGAGRMAKNDEAGVAQSVEVLEQGRVGNLDYEIVKSEDAQKLTDWLLENKYEVRQSLTSWLQPYLNKKWVITAFKIAKDEKLDGAATKAVRMSFEAREPFFPYREPLDMNDAKGKRLLRVFFIGDGKAFALAGGMNWAAKLAWADRPSAEQWNTVLPHLNLPGIDLNNRWLTEFEDSSSPRTGNVDVTFVTKGSDQTPVKRPPNIIFTSSNTDALPTFVGFAAIVACLYLGRALRFAAGRK